MAKNPDRSPAGVANGRARRWIKRIGFTVVGVVALAGAALVAGAQLGERKQQRQVKVDVPALVLHNDAQSVERGRYLFLSRGCAECHGSDGGGKVFVDDGNGMLLRAPDITPGPGNVVSDYAAADWDRAIRHGIKPDGRPIIFMPSEDYNRLTDADFGALEVFLRQMPPVKGQPALVQLPMTVKALYGFGVIRDAAEKIDHRLPSSTPLPQGATAQYGAYVANGCIGCHGANFAGGKIPGTPPDWPPAADLRPGGALDAYADAQALDAMFRTGKRPDGSPVSRVMPFGTLKELNDNDVQALFLYLHSLPRAGQTVAASS